SKLRNFVFVRNDRVLAADFDYEYIGLNQPRLRTVVFLARAGVELLDDIDLLHNGIERLIQSFRDFFELLVLQFMKMIPDDVHGQTFVLANKLQLNQQAFAQIPRSDTRRVEMLNDFQRFPNVLQGVLATFGNFLERDWNLFATLIYGTKISVF